MTGWRSHSTSEEAQVQEDDLLIPELVLRPDAASCSLLATLLPSPMPASMGRAQGGFLGCGPSLGHEIDFLRGLGAFLPLAFPWRGERLL